MLQYNNMSQYTCYNVYVLLTNNKIARLDTTISVNLYI